jgi:hypothetical protein
MSKGHPPKPRLSLSVGVTGHRLHRLPEHARDTVGQSLDFSLSEISRLASETLGRHARFFADAPPALTLVTALAEGADSMAAQAASDAGYKLDVVLPFSAEEYEKDFSPRDAKKFTELLEKAEGSFQLDGTRADEGKAYEAAGLDVLDSSDILIAVWDGKPSAGRGSTVDMINEAARRGMPIVRIDAEGKANVKLLWHGLGHRHAAPTHLDDHPWSEMTETLGSVVDSLLRPPAAKGECDAYLRYTNERAIRWSPRIEFPLLLALLGIRPPSFSDVKLPQPSELARDLRVDGAAGDLLPAAYGWSDAVAIRLAQTFRSAYVSNFLISALATIAAIVAFAPPWSVLEIALVLVLVVNTTVGQRRHWHHRWIEAREVATRLRVAAAAHAVGTRISERGQGHPAWPDWYVRAMLREAGLRSGRLDSRGLDDARASLAALVVEQRNYHEHAAARFQRLHDRLAQIGQYLFVAALALAAGQFVVAAFHLLPVAGSSKYLLGVVSATLPALGAAFYGIRVIGDFDGTARRSMHVKKQLDPLVARLEDGAATFDLLRDTLHHAADVMLADIANWRLVVESRGLEMPG